MIITYYGADFIKLQFGDVVVGINPISKESKWKSGRFAAELALVSLNQKDFSGTDSLAFGDKTPFIINGPGEYEVNGIAIAGFSSGSKYEGEERFNTIYLINLEDMKICHLGALSDTTLAPEAKAHLEDIDVLFVSVGGPGLLTAEEAYKICVDIGPKIIIPMMYEEDGGKPLKAFLKEAGAPDVKPVEKLTLKKKDLEGKDGEVIVLQSTLG
ncbi:MAG: MBL fold metallo-hydrolase [Candidatus Paceibacterota bacterium]|jgi:L-ascorbate metabolism protein UlaG (beta-lactamase superfamily)|nr:MBL fold metallo-hydrolase [Candidatus Paceibacterota bacterium]